MNGAGHELLEYLHKQQHIPFSVRGRLDENRYLPREFPEAFPFLVQLHRYPGYKQVMGEQWLHWHDYYELVIMVSGSGVYQCGTERFEFHAGDILLVESLKLHGVWNVTKEHTALCIFFHANAVVSGTSWVDRGFLAAFDHRKEGVLPRIKADDASADLWAAFRRLTQEWFKSADMPHDLLALKSRFFEVLYHLRENMEVRNTMAHEAPHVRATRERRVRTVLDYIAKHAHERISQSAVAQVAGMSTSRFRAFFKATTGWGYAEYLLDVRIEQAAKLLRDTRDSVAEVAQAAGFSDQSHLQRAFKARHGVSPLMYRKRHQGEASE